VLPLFEILELDCCPVCDAIGCRPTTEFSGRPRPVKHAGEPAPIERQGLAARGQALYGSRPAATICWATVAWVCSFSVSAIASTSLLDALHEAPARHALCRFRQLQDVRCPRERALKNLDPRELRATTESGMPQAADTTPIQ